MKKLIVYKDLNMNPDKYTGEGLEHWVDEKSRLWVQVLQNEQVIIEAQYTQWSNYLWTVDNTR